MEQGNQSYACFTPSFECNWNVNGKSALVEKPPGQPGINKSVKYVSCYTKIQYNMVKYYYLQ